MRVLPVDRFKDKIVEVTKIIEVEKPVPYAVTENVINTIVVEKIVEVPRTIERLK